MPVLSRGFIDRVTRQGQKKVGMGYPIENIILFEIELLLLSTFYNIDFENAHKIICKEPAILSENEAYSF